MNKEGDQTTTPASPPVGFEPAQGRENLEKVRDLLFGPQMRSLETKVTRLEERLRREISDLRDEIRKRIDSLEQFAKNEFNTVVTRITSEQERRADAVKQLKADLRNAVEAFDEKTSQLDNRLEQTAKELREQLLTQARQLTDEILQKHEDALRVIEATADQIRTEHVNRANMSRIFAEMAVGVNSGLDAETREDREDSGHG